MTDFTLLDRVRVIFNRVWVIFNRVWVTFNRVRVIFNRVRVITHLEAEFLTLALNLVYRNHVVQVKRPLLLGALAVGFLAGRA